MKTLGVLLVGVAVASCGSSAYSFEPVSVDASVVVDTGGPTQTDSATATGQTAAAHFGASAGPIQLALPANEIWALPTLATYGEELLLSFVVGSSSLPDPNWQIRTVGHRPWVDIWPYWMWSALSFFSSETVAPTQPAVGVSAYGFAWKLFEDQDRRVRWLTPERGGAFFDPPIPSRDIVLAEAMRPLFVEGHEGDHLLGVASDSEFRIFHDDGVSVRVVLAGCASRVSATSDADGRFWVAASGAMLFAKPDARQSCNTGTDPSRVDVFTLEVSNAGQLVRPVDTFVAGLPVASVYVGRAPGGLWLFWTGSGPDEQGGAVREHRALWLGDDGVRTTAYDTSDSDYDTQAAVVAGSHLVVSQSYEDRWGDEVPRLLLLSEAGLLERYPVDESHTSNIGSVRAMASSPDGSELLTVGWVADYTTTRSGWVVSRLRLE